AAQSRQIVAEFGAAADHLAGGFDLAAGQLELEFDAVLGSVPGDGLVDGDGFPRGGIDKEELLLDAHGGVAGHSQSIDPARRDYSQRAGSGKTSQWGSQVRVQTCRR